MRFYAKILCAATHEMMLYNLVKSPLPRSLLYLYPPLRAFTFLKLFSGTLDKERVRLNYVLYIDSRMLLWHINSLYFNLSRIFKITKNILCKWRQCVFGLNNAGLKQKSHTA